MCIKAYSQAGEIEGVYYHCHILLYIYSSYYLAYWKSMQSYYLQGETTPGNIIGTFI